MSDPESKTTKDLFPSIKPENGRPVDTPFKRVKFLKSISWIALTALSAYIGALASEAAHWNPLNTFSLFSHHHHTATATPAVHITGVTWPSNEGGLFNVTGTAENVPNGSLLYSFNQKVINNNLQQIYPGSGPCLVQANQTFRCVGGYAGSSRDHDVDYEIIVAIVTIAQAYRFAEERASSRYYDTPFANTINELPHMNGPSTLDQYRTTRTN